MEHPHYDLPPRREWNVFHKLGLPSAAQLKSFERSIYQCVIKRSLGVCLGQMG